MTIATLDYPKAKLTMEVPEAVGSWRLGACAKEPWTLDFIESIPAGGVFWDIGANVGSYTLIAAARPELEVVAIEPAYENYRALCKNLSLNNLLGRVIAFCNPVTPVDGFIWLHYADMRSGAAQHVVGDQRKEGFHQQQMLGLSLDTLVAWVSLAGPRFLKIDVDGGEVGVLQGAADTLANPLTQGMMIEMQRPFEPQITTLLESHNWRLAGRYSQRNGQELPHVVYGEYRRS